MIARCTLSNNHLGTLKKQGLLLTGPEGRPRAIQWVHRGKSIHAHVLTWNCLYWGWRCLWCPGLCRFTPYWYASNVRVSSLVAQTVKSLQCGRPGFDPWVGKILWRRKWQLTPVFLPGEFHGQRNLAGYCPWGHRVGYNWVTNTFTFSTICSWKIFAVIGLGDGYVTTFTKRHKPSLVSRLSGKKRISYS